MTWTVRDVMTADPVTVEQRTPFKTCLNLMRVHELSAIPVVDAHSRLLGIVSEADLLAKEAQRSVRPPHDPATTKARAMTVGELMSGDLVTTTEDAPLSIAASLMFEHHLKVLPVVGFAKRLVGTVTRYQVLNVFLRTDESIRREVARELQLVPAIIRGNVEAEVRDGVVHLHGETREESVTDVLTQLVAGIPGVVGLESHLKPAKMLAGAAARVGDGSS